MLPLPFSHYTSTELYSHRSLWLSSIAPVLVSSPQSFLRSLFLLLNGAYTGKMLLYYRNALGFPWALGLRTLVSLGAMPFVQMRSWSLCIPDIVVLGVQGSLPAQSLSRNVLMSGSSCVLPAHALRRHPALL